MPRLGAHLGAIMWSMGWNEMKVARPMERANAYLAAL
jgi:hypothetical protein